MNTNTIGRCAIAAAFATVLSLAAASACLAASTSGGVAKLDQPGSGYHGYSTYVPTLMVLLPGPDYSTSYWAPDPTLTWHPGE